MPLSLLVTRVNGLGLRLGVSAESAAGAACGRQALQVTVARRLAAPLRPKIWNPYYHGIWQFAAGQKNEN